MLNYLKNEANTTFTENGAVTYRTTGSDCLDLFSTVGAIRRESEAEIVRRFSRAFYENADLAMKILFFARDVRGGLGERRVFRVIVKWLADNGSESLKKNIERIPEYGRFDDLLALVGTACEDEALRYLQEQLNADVAAQRDGGEVSLLAKWLPSVNTSNAEAVRLAKKLAKRFGMSDAVYRKTLVGLRAQIRILENNLRERDYTFDYAKQPSKAMYKYRKAFIRNDKERYCEFLSRVESGEERLHTGTLAPYEIIAPCFRSNSLSEEEKRSMDVAWNAQESFGGDADSLVVVDGSGSMYWSDGLIPEAVALSLGVYFAERNCGAFHNRFITFSTTPQLVEIKGKNIVEKVRYCAQFNECANTNLQKVFELLIRTAVKNKVPKDEMPKTLYIVSDMEFDECADDATSSNFEYAKALFEGYGYTLPAVVFWNVASRTEQQPVKMNEQGVALVSGCTPRLFSVLAEGILDPYTFMTEAVMTERYAPITA